MTAPQQHSDPTSAVDRDDLVQQHLPLVGHIVRGFMARVPGHVARDDLMSAGMFALVQAANAYDAGRGVAFGGYASTRVRGAILDELRGLDWVSRSVRRRERSAEQARNTLAASLGRTPSDAELASALGLGLSELASHREDVSRGVVMSLQAFDDATADSVLPASGTTPVEVLEQRERIGYLHDAVAELPHRLRSVVESYYFEDRPMAEIAAELEVTESRVSQLRAEAVALLQGALSAALEPDTPSAADSTTATSRPDGVATRRKESYYAAVAAHRSFAARLAPVAHENVV